MQQVVVYYKQDCHLCDSLLEALGGLQQQWSPRLPFEIVLCDIEEKPSWLERYREYVPVVVVNDEEICHYFLEPQELEAALLCR